MQPLILGVLAFALGLATIWRAARRPYRVFGALLAIGGVAAMTWNHPAEAHLQDEHQDIENLCNGAESRIWEWSTPVSNRRDEPAPKDLFEEVTLQSSTAQLFQDILASLLVVNRGAPVTAPGEEPVPNYLLDDVAFRSSQALVLHDALRPILRRCVAVWTDDCQSWLDALSIPEDDSDPFVVPPGRARTAAALQEALRTHACPKYVPMP